MRFNMSPCFSDELLPVQVAAEQSLLAAEGRREAGDYSVTTDVRVGEPAVGRFGAPPEVLLLLVHLVLSFAYFLNET